MDFSFDVGERERHRVDFSFNPTWGNLRIAVDGTTVQRDLLILGLTMVKAYEFDVGVAEPHHVRIEMHRKVLFAGFRSRGYRIYVDGQQVNELQGY